MARGVSINIGVNTLSKELTGVYKKALGSPKFTNLKSSARDAEDFSKILKQVGFEIKPERYPSSNEPKFAENEDHLERVKVEPVLKAIREFSTQLIEDGSFLIITFSGHSMKIPQIPPTEIDAVDKVIPAEASWCFYDRPMLDDELTEVLSEFNEKVRIVIISDSCHSGTVIDKSLLGLIGENIPNLNLKVLEKAVLEANGFKSIKLNELEKIELDRTINILNQDDIIQIRKENIDKLQETHFRERIRNTTVDSLLNEGMTKDEIERFLDKIKITELDKNLNLFASNKLMIKTMQNDKNFLKGLSKIKLKDKTFDELNKKLDLLLTDNLKIIKLEDIPLIKNSKLIPETLAERIYKENEPKFIELRTSARRKIKDKKDFRLASGEKLIRAKVIFLTACQDGESTIAGCDKDKNSEYTKAILEIWNGGTFAGSYEEFQNALEKYFKKTSWENPCEVGKTYEQSQKPLKNFNDVSFFSEHPMFNL